MAGQPLGGQPKAEFLGQFAQAAVQRRLAGFGAAAGQVPMRGKRNPVVIVAQTGQQPAPMGQDQLGADET